MIFFVDEDMGECSPYSIALGMQNFTVTTLPDASVALADLRVASDVELVFIDVMLARGSDPDGLFTSELTGRGLQTGLRLLDSLVDHNDKVFPRRAVLLSAATDNELVKSIEAHGRHHGVPFWRKTDFATTSDFVRKVQLHLRSIEG
jgi:hypothetical protein